MGFLSSIGKVAKSVGGGVIKGIGGGIAGYMSGGWGGAAAGALGTLGDTASAYQAYTQTKKGIKQQNQLAQQAAKDQYGMQKHSYKHRYQWQMDDMKKAGLNPLLAYSQGAGSALGGATYQPQSPESGALGSLQAATSARAQTSQAKIQAAGVQQVGQQIKQSKAQIQNLNTDTNLKVQSTHESQTRSALQRADTRKRDQEIKNLQETHGKIKAEAAKVRHEVTSASALAAAAREDKKFYDSDTGKVFRWVDRAVGSISPVKRALK